MTIFTEDLDKNKIQWRENFIKKRSAPLRPLLRWTKIYLVDGTAIRDLIDSDFVEGGNDQRYSWIPKNEIWIDATVPESEWSEIMLHESIESLHMMEGDSYDEAHDKARTVEDNIRHEHLPKEELEPPKAGEFNQFVRLANRLNLLF